MDKITIKIELKAEEMNRKRFLRMADLAAHNIIRGVSAATVNEEDDEVESILDNKEWHLEIRDEGS